MRIYAYPSIQAILVIIYYTQPVLFTILAIKVYTRTTYRQITDLLQLSDRIKQYLGIKNVSITSQHCRNFSKNYHQAYLKQSYQLILTLISQ